MKRRFSVFSTLLSAFLLFSSPSAWGWNAAGHRLVASIAWSTLEPTSRQQLAALLRQHPDYPRWVRHAGKQGNPEQTAFVEASTWADDIRRDPRFHHTDEPATEILPGFPDMLRHANWHYADALPNGVVPDKDAENLYSALSKLAPVVGNHQNPPAQRAYALVWLLHLVGDAHQPLHNGIRDDRGGNDFELIWFKPKTNRTLSLHTFWDDLPGQASLRGTELYHTAEALTRLHPYTVSSIDTRFALWQQENLAVTRRYGYPSNAAPPVVLDAAFIEQSRRVANERLATAGYRLAALLKLLLNPQNRTPFHVERRSGFSE